MGTRNEHAAFGTDALVWRMPWCPLDPEPARIFTEELARELPAGHVLFGVAAVALARRDDNDDVLYGIKHPAARLAVVHLTYQRENNPRWPRAGLFASADDFVRRRMLPDAEGTG